MIIGISGKINAGKDLVGNIIQILTNFPKMSTERVVEMVDKDFSNNVFEIKKFADYLKDIVCILIGCTREQLEDREFKEKELGEEWEIVKMKLPFLTEFKEIDMLFNSIEEAHNYAIERGYTRYDAYKVSLTPRLLLQLIGTECMRNTIHPNTWVNALFNKYKDKRWISKANFDVEKGLPYNAENDKPIYPNWVITDMRFPNELKAVKDKGGITIRVNREYQNPLMPEISIPEHPSETALDNAEFDYIIQNDGTIEDLVIKVREILVKENIIL